MSSIILGVLIALIGAGGAVTSAYMIARTNNQDRILSEINITVNGRLTAALNEMDRMQALITKSRLTGEPIPSPYGRRAEDWAPQRRQGERDYVPPDER